MNDYIYNTSGSLNKKRLEKLNDVRKLFIIPMFFWFLIIILDVVLFAFRIDEILWLRKAVAKAAFYSFPFLLIYLVIVTFYSSYRILESKNYKNMVIFFFIQAVAYYLNDVVEISIPQYGKSKSIMFTVIIAVSLFFIISIVQLRIKLPEDDEGKDIQSKPLMGNIVSAIFSIVIASMIYFRVREGIPFIMWGVFFGSFLSAIIIKPDKMILGLFYFLDPSGARNLFRLKKLKEKVYSQKQEIEVLKEEDVYEKEKMKAKLIHKAIQIEKEVATVQFEDWESQLAALLNKIRDSKNLPASERRKIIDNIKGVSKAMKEGEGDIYLALPEMNYKDFNNGERIHLQTGFDEQEIEELVKEGLIDVTQKYLWTFQNQNRIRIALTEFEKENYKGKPPLYVANSMEDYFTMNPNILKRLTEILISEESLTLKKIKGTRNPELFELIFTTVVKRYSAVVAKGQEGSFLLLGVFDITT